MTVDVPLGSIPKNALFTTIWSKLYCVAPGSVSHAILPLLAVWLMMLLALIRCGDNDSLSTSCGDDFNLNEPLPCSFDDDHISMNCIDLKYANNIHTYIKTIHHFISSSKLIPNMDDLSLFSPPPPALAKAADIPATANHFFCLCGRMPSSNASFVNLERKSISPSFSLSLLYALNLCFFCFVLEIFYSLLIMGEGEHWRSSASRLPSASVAYGTRWRDTPATEIRTHRRRERTHSTRISDCT